MITGKGQVIAHIGYPTTSFKAPMIYNPWFEAQGIDATVVPLGIEPHNFAALFRPMFHGITTLHGALITMPHKVTVLGHVDELSTATQIAGAANAVLKRPDGTLLADMFDGAGFVRGMQRKGQRVEGASALLVGAGGVGSAIAASLAAAGLARLTIADIHSATAEALAARIQHHHPAIQVQPGPPDPATHGIVVNATPLGMNEHDPIPIDPTRLDPGAFVGEVVMRETFTPLLRAARARGCPIQVGTDMLFEMIPAYLEFFGFGTATADELRATARLPD